MNKYLFISVRCLVFSLIVTVAAIYGQKNDINKTVLDFDGDGQTDLVAIQKLDGALIWHIQQSQDGYRSLAFGIASLTDIAIPADYDGDGKWDVAIWRRGVAGGQAHFWILNSSSQAVTVIPWGRPFDYPRATQDFDGDGKADPTVVRANTANGLVWWTLFSRTGEAAARQLGTYGDYYLRGDYDGDGRADVAVYHATVDGITPPYTFIIQMSSTGKVLYERFGEQIDFVIPADFDGDTRTDLAIYRFLGSGGNKGAYWHWINSSDGSHRSYNFGLAIGAVTGQVDYPAPGDYDGDGVTDFAIWRTKRYTDIQSEFHIFGSKMGYVSIPWGKDDMEILNYKLQVAETAFPQ